MKIKITDVVIREDLYPRIQTDPQLIQRYALDIEKLPAIEVNQHNELIDGMHRHTAHRQENLETIEVFVTKTASDNELLKLACKRNATHGYQLKTSDKQAMTRKLYQVASDKERPALKKELIDILSVSKSSIDRWVKQIDQDAEKERKQKTFDLWLSCHTQKEIGELVDVTQQTVSNYETEFTNIRHLTKICKFVKNSDPEYLNTDFFNYDVFTQNALSKDQVKHFGNSEVTFVDRLIHSYTKPWDIVIDPFGGGGSTIDICKKRFRRYYVSDLTPIVAREKEIRQHDILTSMPKLPSWKDVRLVYLDPPYWKQAEGKYSKKNEDLANMSLDQFHSGLIQIINGFAKKLSPGAKIAFIIQSTQWNAPDRKRVDHLWEIGRYLDIPLIERIQAPYSSQQCNPQMVNWSNENKVRLVISREIAVWEIT